MWHDTKDVWLAGHDGDDRYRVTLQHIGSKAYSASIMDHLVIEPVV